MRARKAGLWVFILLICGISACDAAAAEVQNRLVAIVNSDVVTLYELNERIRLMTRKDPNELRSMDESAFMNVRRKVLNGLIEEKLAMEKVKELGIQVGPKEVDSTIERIKETNSLTQDDLVAALQKDGMSFEEYRENVRKQIERMQLISAEVRSKIIIRDELIQEYYENHRDEFVVDEEVHLASIFLTDKGAGIPGSRQMLVKKAESIVAELAAGGDFAKAAATYSDGPGAKEGGDLGVFKASQLNEDLREQIRDMPIGGVSEPVPTSSGYQIIKLLDRKGGRVKSAEEMKDAIFEKLYTAEVEKRYIEWMKGLREKAYVKIIF